MCMMRFAVPSWVLLRVKKNSVPSGEKVPAASHASVDTRFGAKGFGVVPGGLESRERGP